MNYGYRGEHMRFQEECRFQRRLVLALAGASLFFALVAVLVWLLS